MAKTREIVMLSLKDIVPDEHQPRSYFDAKKLASLKDSVNRYGIKNPLIVDKVGSKYLLIDGERRFKVAEDLGLKEVPVIVEEPKSETERLIEQFHIQEQHESWTPTEKALTFWKLCDLMKIPTVQAARLLSLDIDTARRYASFAQIVDKNAYAKSEIPLDYVDYINSVRKSAKLLTVNKLEEEFTRTDEKKLEAVLIARVKNGQISNRQGFTKIKDSFYQDPKTINEFMTTQISPDKLFIKTKASGARAARNINNNSRNLFTFISEFMNQKEVSLDESIIKQVKQLKTKIDKLLESVE